MSLTINGPLAMTLNLTFVVELWRADEFHRAVKICTGIAQSKHLVSTVFAIFDADGDGLLSYREFIAIMKDRLHRGFKVSAPLPCVTKTHYKWDL
jgi:hypothetical protein